MNTHHSEQSRSLPVPSWRWQKGVQLAEERSGAYQPCPDQGVRAARRYWSLWLRAREEGTRRQLAQTMPTVHEAFALYRDGGIARTVLEARVLAGEDRAAIAGKGGLAADVVRTYEALFFAVRSALDCPDYIVTRVLGTSRRPGQSKAEAARERTWKLFAYLGGPWAVDALASASSTVKRPTDFSEGVSFLGEETQAVLGWQVLVAVQTAVQQLADSDPQKAAALLRSFSLLGRDRDDRPLNRYEENVAALFKSLRPHLVGDSKAEENLSPEDIELDRCLGELRAHELFQRALGMEVQGIDQLKVNPFAGAPVQESLPGQPSRSPPVGPC